MTNKEYLELAIKEFEKEQEENQNNEWLRRVIKGMKVCKQDLEILEILKKYVYYEGNNHFIKMKRIRKSIYNFDYEYLKEWLENE